MLPNVFVAGAQKSGTTSLCSLISRHPQAILSNPKEPAFFSCEANLSSLERYEQCFHAKAGATPRAIVDGSNAYMVDRLAISRIRRILGENLRFIFCLRDPVERMVSAYWHQAKKGHELRGLADVFSFASYSLESAVCEEENRLGRALANGLVDVSAYTDRFDDPLWNHRYLRNSLYASDLERFHENFGRERVKVIFFEDLVNEPSLTLASLAVFLDLDPGGFPNRIEARNPTLLYRAPFLSLDLRYLPGRRILRRLPGYARLHRLLVYRKPPAAPTQLKGQLRRLVAPEIKRLECMFRRELLAMWGHN